jgi:hypothetical protein
MEMQGQRTLVIRVAQVVQEVLVMPVRMGLTHTRLVLRVAGAIRVTRARRATLETLDLVVRVVTVVLVALVVPVVLVALVVLVA